MFLQIVKEQRKWEGILLGRNACGYAHHLQSEASTGRRAFRAHGLGEGL
jgi:hypothetical protein